MNNRILVITKSTFFDLVHRKAILIMGTIFFLGFFSPLFISTKFLSINGEVRSPESLIPTLVQFVLFIGLITCIFYAANLVKNETNGRTITSIMVRPIHRWEFLCGMAFGVILYFMIYIFLSVIFAQLAAILTNSSLTSTFFLGIIQRLFRGITFIMIAATLGAFISATNTVLIFVFCSFFSLVLSHIPEGIHWSMDFFSSTFYYLMPAEWKVDLIKESSMPDLKELLPIALGMFENLFYGIFIFLIGSKIFEESDLKLREN